MKPKTWFTGILALVSLLGFVSTGLAQESRLDMVIKRDKLIVGTYTTAPPLCFTDESGKLVGFEIDLVRIIAKALLGDPNKVEFVPITGEGRWPAVLSGKVDFGIAATTVYPERGAKVAFTQPYMDTGIAVLVRKESGINKLSDLNNPKFTLAEQNNPQDADRAQRYVPKAKRLDFETPSAQFLAVQSGRAQALQTDVPVADWYAKQYRDMKVLPELMSSLQNNAIFLKPGDFTWWLFLDTVVQELRYGSYYDQYADLYQKWFGKTPPPQRFYIKR